MNKDWKEELADIEHRRWSDWQKYLHSKCLPVLDESPKLKGGLLIPRELVSHWERQINTDYKDLSEKEKDSDREQVDRYLPIIQSLLDKKDQEWKDKIEDIKLDEFLSDKKYNNGYNNGYKEATKEWKDKILEWAEKNTYYTTDGDRLLEDKKIIKYLSIRLKDLKRAIEDIKNKATNNKSFGAKCLKDNNLQHAKNTGLGGKALR